MMDKFPVPTRMRRYFNALTEELFRFEKYDRVLNLACGHDIDREGSTYSEYFCANSVIRSDVALTTEYAKFEVPFSGGLSMKNPVDIFANAENLPFEDNLFDLVFCNWALHDFDREKALNEICRVLKNHGHFFATYCRPPESFMYATRIMLTQCFERLAMSKITLFEHLDGRDGSAEMFFGVLSK